MDSKNDNNNCKVTQTNIYKNLGGTKMARFNISEAENYGGQGCGGYFSLKNNGDSQE